MLWPFNHFSKPRAPLRATIDAIYGMIVTQAREPPFYRDLGVPDTVNGRFDLCYCICGWFCDDFDRRRNAATCSAGPF